MQEILKLSLLIGTKATSVALIIRMGDLKIFAYSQNVSSSKSIRWKLAKTTKN